MKTEATQRGFQRGEFEDTYGSECSIQESSNAGVDAIWLGIDRPFTANPEAGFVGRMHLDQELVKQLLPLLAYFAENGRLPSEG